MRAVRTPVAFLLLLSLAACKQGGSAGGTKSEGAASGGNPACAGARVDLTKLSGDWIASATIKQPEGTYSGDQYRIRFHEVDASGKAKASMAWRLDSRPFTGEITKNALGQKLVLLEEMTDEVIAQLKASGNQDPNLAMRAAIHIAPAEKGCVLEVTDNFQSFLGDKTIEKTSPIGSLKLVPAPAGTVYSFVRCDVQRGITFDGKSDEGGRPVVLKAGAPTKVRAVAAKNAFPEGCDTFEGDVFVDGIRVAEKLPATIGEEDKVPAVIWEKELSIEAGSMRGVELHAYAACGDRKLVASACNLVQAQ